MELRHLRYFVAAAEEGTLTRAGERVHVAQQGLSKQIAELEHELGVRLFERTARGLRLTAAGEAFLLEARVILARSELAVDRARAAARGSRHELRVGSVAQGYTDELVTAARRALLSDGVVAAADGDSPVHSTVVHLSSAEQIAALRAARIDLAVVHGPTRPSEDLSVARVADRSLVGVIVAAEHPLAQHDVIPGGALRGRAGATFPREWNPEAWERVHGAFTALGADLRSDEALTTLQSALAAATTLGWWVPAPPAVAAWLPPSVTYRRVEGLDVPFVVEAVSRAADGSPAVERFVRALRAAESSHWELR